MPRGSKTCPQCKATTGPRTKVCPECSHQYIIGAAKSSPRPGPPVGPPPVGRPTFKAPPGPPALPRSQRDGNDDNRGDSAGSPLLPIPSKIRSGTDEVLTELFNLMMKDASDLAENLDAFRRLAGRNCTDDLWFTCWRKNFQRLSACIRQTLKIEKQRDESTP